MRKIAALLILFMLSGCTYSDEPESMAYLVAIGFDEAADDALSVTFMFTASGSQSDESECVTVTAPSLYSAIRYASSFRSKDFELSHTKLVVFSEDVAKRGVSEYVRSFAKNIEFRPNVYFCVSRCSAKELLESVKTDGASYAEKYFEQIFSSSGIRQNRSDSLAGVLFTLFDENGDVTMILGDVNSGDGEYGMNYIDADFKAGEVPSGGGEKAEFAGAAIFSGDKMTGEVTEGDASIIRMVQYGFKKEYFTVGETSARITQSKRPKISVDTSGDSPQITVKVSLECELMENADENFAQSFSLLAKRRAEALFYRARDEYDSDVFGFYAYAKKNFADINAWRDYNWGEKFKKANMDISFDIKTVKTYGTLEE